MPPPNDRQAGTARALRVGWASCIQVRLWPASARCPSPPRCPGLGRRPPIRICLSPRKCPRHATLLPASCHRLSVLPSRPSSRTCRRPSPLTARNNRLLPISLWRAWTRRTSRSRQKKPSTGPWTDRVTIRRCCRRARASPQACQTSTARPPGLIRPRILAPADSPHRHSQGKRLALQTTGLGPRETDKTALSTVDGMHESRARRPR